MGTFEDKLTIGVLNRMLGENAVRPVSRAANYLNSDGSSGFLPALRRIFLVNVEVVTDFGEALKVRVTSDRRRRLFVWIDLMRERESRESIFVAVFEMTDEVPA